MVKFGILIGALALATTAQAAPIVGLYNTGVIAGGSNTAAGGGATTGNGIEPNWTMTAGTGTAPSTAFNGGVNNTFPIGPWLQDTSTSRWVTPTSNAATSYDPSANGTYTFSLNFVLSAADAAKASFNGRFAVDNFISGATLNGKAITTFGSGGFSSWTKFAALRKDGGFNGGNNVLSFNVVNAAQNGGNPLGFRAEFLASSVPEPTTWAMMIGGFGIVGGAMRRRRTMVARIA